MRMSRRAVVSNNSKTLDSYTKILLHMDGANGGTTFTDETGRTWSRGSNAQLNTTSVKFGTASGLFSSSTQDWIYAGASSDFYVQSGDFTVDFWVKRISIGINFLCGQCDSAGSTSTISFRVYFDNSSYPRAQVCSGSTTYTTAQGGTSVTDMNWHHIAAIRYGDFLRLYLDGVAQGSVSVAGVAVNSSAYQMSIGRCGEYNASYTNGRIDEFRFSKGIARWTADFTPPTTPY